MVYVCNSGISRLLAASLEPVAASNIVLPADVRDGLAFAQVAAVADCYDQLLAGQRG
jgi:hypothetical protein